MNNIMVDHVTMGKSISVRLNFRFRIFSNDWTKLSGNESPINITNQSSS